MESLGYWIVLVSPQLVSAATPFLIENTNCRLEECFRQSLRVAELPPPGFRRLRTRLASRACFGCLKFNITLPLQRSQLDPIEKITMTLDYLFGRGVSRVLPTSQLRFQLSKRTGKIRFVMIGRKLVGTFRPDGGFALTLFGANLLSKHPRFKKNSVVVAQEAVPFVSEGRSVFAKHVTWCGSAIRPGSEVVVQTPRGRVIAVGKAVLSAKMMKRFKVGPAIKIRQGSKS